NDGVTKIRGVSDAQATRQLATHGRKIRQTGMWQALRIVGRWPDDLIHEQCGIFDGLGERSRNGGVPILPVLVWPLWDAAEGCLQAESPGEARGNADRSPSITGCD